ncbi:hypothetical protein BGW42_006841 [Actinomortierella wolfii]|nr:hypothetical protein BGW42_006841 [Actinomortierella wolfii]
MMKQDSSSPSSPISAADTSTPVETTSAPSRGHDIPAQVSFIKILTKDSMVDSTPSDVNASPDWFSPYAREMPSDVSTPVFGGQHHQHPGPHHPLQTSSSSSLAVATPAPVPNVAHATAAFGGYTRGGGDDLQHPSSLYIANQLYRQGRGSDDSTTTFGPLSSLLGSHANTSLSSSSSTVGTQQQQSTMMHMASPSTSSNGSVDREAHHPAQKQQFDIVSSLENTSINGSTSPSGTLLQQQQQQQQQEQQKEKDVIVENRPKKVVPDACLVTAEHFEPDRHFYPRVLNAQIHPMVGYFFSLGNERIIARYMHLNPQVNETVLRKCLEYRPKHFQWAGSDLFNVTTADGHRQMIIVETNSCPSGQKSMPLLTESDEHGGYRTVLDSAFRDMIEKADRSLGDLAVVYDKNTMEATGYASTLADVMKEKVWSVEFYEDDTDPPVKWVDRVMYIRDSNKEWHSIRACFRYVTQKPWNRFPIHTRTIVMNQTVACLAGGRNKMMAAKAYEFFNAELVNSGLHVRVPETINNVTKSEIPLWLDSMGGHAVVKVPYSNAGQGVYTITNKEELKEFMETPHHYDKFIVQSLVGNASWSSITRQGKFYHVGTIPNKKTNTFVSDLRMMVAGNRDGFRPICIYARRARKPLIRHLSDDPSVTSWEMLGTNLSVKSPTGEWSTEAARLLLMDRKDFNQLGLGVDDMIDAYIQTVLSVIAIDKMCQRLVRTTDEGEHFDMELFKALNPDSVLWQEILV